MSDLATRVWAKIEKRSPEECWLWTGATGQKDGPVTTLKKKTLSTRRVIWELEHGGVPLPRNRQVATTCKAAKCLNPAHLYLRPWMDDVTRFWTHVRKGEGDACWEWHGTMFERLVLDARRRGEEGPPGASRLVRDRARPHRGPRTWASRARAGRHAHLRQPEMRPARPPGARNRRHQHRRHDRQGAQLERQSPRGSDEGCEAKADRMSDKDKKSGLSSRPDPVQLLGRLVHAIDSSEGIADDQHFENCLDDARRYITDSRVLIQPRTPLPFTSAPPKGGE